MRTWLAAEAAGLAVHPVSPLFIYAHGEANFHALVGDRYADRLARLANQVPGPLRPRQVTSSSAWCSGSATPRRPSMRSRASPSTPYSRSPTR